MKNRILIVSVFLILFAFDLNGQVTLKDVAPLHEGHTSLYFRTVDKKNEFGQREYARTEFYVKTEGDENLTKLYSQGVFGNGTGKKNLKKYFQDCPKLIELIKNNAFKKYFENKTNMSRFVKLNNRFIEMVKFYNDCKKPK